MSVCSDPDALPTQAAPEALEEVAAALERWARQLRRLAATLQEVADRERASRETARVTEEATGGSVPRRPDA